MEDPALYRRMSAESLVVIREKFDLRVRNERLLAIYEQALA